jgi:hypothetical protein
MSRASFKTGAMNGNKLNVRKSLRTFNCCRQSLKARKGLAGKVMPFLLTVLMTASMISCQYPRQDIARISKNASLPETILIPQWYAMLPNIHRCRLAYGYGGVYLDAAHQKEVLLKNAAANMAKNDKVFIQAGWAGTQVSDEGLTASYIMEKGWQKRASVLEKNLKIVRQYQMENSMIALCASCPDESLLQGLTDQIDDRLVNINSDESPEWVQSPESKSGYVYGVGTASSRIKPAEAWEEAERQARAALAFNLSAHQDVLQKTISENTGSGIRNFSEIKTEIALADVVILRHGYSRSEKSFYALAQMPAPAARVNTGR